MLTVKDAPEVSQTAPDYQRQTSKHGLLHLNSRQLKVLWLGIGLIVLMGLVPPWVSKYEGQVTALLGYCSIFSPPDGADAIDAQRLKIQWLLVSVVCAGCMLSIRSSRSSSSGSAISKRHSGVFSERYIGALRAEVLIPLAVLALALIPFGLSEYDKAQKRVEREEREAVEKNARRERELKEAAERQAESQRRQIQWDKKASTLGKPVRYAWKQTATGRQGTIVMSMVDDHTVSYRLDLFGDAPNDHGDRALDFEDQNGLSLLKDKFHFAGGNVVTRQCAIDCETYERIAGFDFLPRDGEAFEEDLRYLRDPLHGTQ